MNKLKFLNPVLFVIIIASFFLPFIEVSCGDDIIVKATAFDIVKDTDYSINKGLSDNKYKEIDYKFIMLGVFVLTTIGLILTVFPLFHTFQKSSGFFFIILIAISFLSFLFVIIYVYTASENLKEAENVLSFKLKYGFFIMQFFYLITVLLNIVIFIFNFKKSGLLHDKKKKSSDNLSLLSEKLCIHCGVYNPTIASFCKNCGNRLNE